ncbi:regulator of G protein signaling domain-containing protein [Gilbertella persicaria]|uniref:regulator of G protein signaling domain-containing protein n=1 Tax=Gilbertella persicaria TaxID=101096 RepID=UPI00221F8DE7|nr:regulator of G protein signaling domain-containing protein [Gilbertella persicaria]KAI8075493.1 regulator of G protein signaling domain-containing protein [Gilbertella persicaria]
MGYNPASNKSILKFTVDGRPSVEDIHDLFSTLISRIKFSSHRHMFRNYFNSFTSEEAITELGSLQFAQSFQLVESESASRISANAPTTSFTMNRDMAKALIQQFLWTRLILNAVEPQNRTYRDKGIWKLSSKGLCVLQEFCVKTKVDIAKFARHVDMSAQLMFLIHIERLKENDRLNCKKRYISSLFAIMIASLPLRKNEQTGKYVPVQAIPSPPFDPTEEDDYCSLDASINSTSTSSRKLTFIDYFPYIKTLPNDLLVCAYGSSQQFSQTTSFPQQEYLLQNLKPASNKFQMRAIFTSLLCCNWLVEHCTVASNDEAESIMTEFLKLGWITFYDKKNKHCDQVESSKSIALNLTRAGMKVVIDISLENSSVSTASETGTTSSYFDFKPPMPSALSNSPLGNKFSSISNTLNNDETSTIHSSKTYESHQTNSVKLTSILTNPHLRSLFRDFLDESFCAENLEFWIDHDNFRKRCRRQKAIAEAASSSTSLRQLLEDAYLLWDTYLKPKAHNELNIDSALREKMAEDMTEMITIVNTSLPGQDRSTMLISTYPTNQTLKSLTHWLEKASDQVFKLMASQSVPKFTCTTQYKNLLQKFQQQQQVVIEANEFREDFKLPQLQRRHTKAQRSSEIAAGLDDFPCPPQRREKEVFKEAFYS